MAQNVFLMVHTLTIAEPIWPMLQNLTKTLLPILFSAYQITSVAKTIMSMSISALDQTTTCTCTRTRTIHNVHVQCLYIKTMFYSTT